MKRVNDGNPLVEGAISQGLQGRIDKGDSNRWKTLMPQLTKRIVMTKSFFFLLSLMQQLRKRIVMTKRFFSFFFTNALIKKSNHHHQEVLVFFLNPSCAFSRDDRPFMVTKKFIVFLSSSQPFHILVTRPLLFFSYSS